MRELIRQVYGSHLYGTSTPKSDTDIKVVYLPDFDDVLLGKKLHIYKVRVDAEGNKVADDAKMPDGGTETEFIPFQTFCRDFMGGQTYALEIAFAVAGRPAVPVWLHGLIGGFLTNNVGSMAGFAMKQTFDYVHRGARLEKARHLAAVLTVLHGNEKHYGLNGKKLRLDTVLNNEKVIHTIANILELELGTTVNNNREMETLKLNGREYLETTTVEHLLNAVEKLVDGYGERSKDAAEKEVDPKSLMHAVRVYQQAIELLVTGGLMFPRPNVRELLAIKTLETPLETTKLMLLQLEEHVATMVERNPLNLQAGSQTLSAKFDRWLLSQLGSLYELPGNWD
jgi:predicted nucleotidyltransferase